MPIQREILKVIAESTLDKIKALPADEVSSILNMADYHGFLKSRLPTDFLDSILSPLHLSEEDVQIEVVEVATDLRHEIHYHERAFAYCVCMGENYHVKPPLHAGAFLHDSWRPVIDGEIVEIPPGTKHGFTIGEGGTLTFLSVQAPPIVGHGHDDYHHAEA